MNTDKYLVERNIPEEYKNDPRILEALPQEYKQKLGITANNKDRLFSSAFNDNYIGTLLF
jgi:hypothetical protein